MNFKEIQFTEAKARVHGVSQFTTMKLSIHYIKKASDKNENQKDYFNSAYACNAYYFKY